MRTISFWISLGFGVMAIVGDFVVPSILARRYSVYSHLRDTISTLGTSQSPVKEQIKAWLILLGIFFLVFAAGQTAQFHDLTWRHWLYTGGIAGFGLGAGILAGLFPEDPVGTTETISGKIHGIGSGCGFILLLLTPLWAWGMAECVSLRVWNILAFTVGLFAFLLFMISGKSGALSGLTGLWQRLCLASLYSSLIMNAFAIRGSAV